MAVASSVALALLALGGAALWLGLPEAASLLRPTARPPLVAALAACVVAGAVAGLWVSHEVKGPLASLEQAAQRIARGQFGVRAEPAGAVGEMAAMLAHFNDMAAALEKLERERRAMVAAFSHELRTPLTVLRARLHAACDGVLSADVGELRRLLGQAEHLSRLVDDLHILAMAEAGRLTLRRAPIDLLLLARESLEHHAPRLAQLGIEARWEPRCERALVDADADRLRQMLSNLIENAIRYGAAGRSLQVSVDVQAGRARLAVSDAGGGDPEAVRRHMLRGLGDAAHPRAPTVGGSGLGLSIVRTLVLQHGGEIEVQPAERAGQVVGVTVRLSLPAIESTGAA